MLQYQIAVVRASAPFYPMKHPQKTGERRADPRLLQPLVQEAVRTGVRVEQVDTMRELGEACGIAVGAAVAVLV